MKIVPLTSITIPENRQRGMFPLEDHAELLSSIWKGPVGLQNPPLVRPNGDGYMLVSGERRLRAVTDLYLYGGELRHAGETIPAGHIPVTLTSELSPLEAWEAELDENIRRLDFSWQERASAVAQLVHLRQEQSSTKVGVIAGELSQTLSITESTASALIVDSLLIERHMADPTIAKAGSAREAVRLIKIKASREESSRSLDVKSAKYNLHLGDCVEVLDRLPPLNARVILTDPPYGINAHTFGNNASDTLAVHDYEDTPEHMEELLRKVAPLLWKHTLPDAHLYMFCDFRHFTRISAILEGWKVFPTPLIWHKPTGFRTPWTGTGPQRKYECILYAMKGDWKVRVVKGDVLTYSMTEDLANGITHNARKPVELFTDLLSRSVLPGDTILDPFCGSGPIFPAAANVACTAVGIELSEAFAGESRRRIAQLEGAV